MQRSDLEGSDLLRAADRERVAAFRAVLDDVGFTAAAVRDALASDASINRDSAELPLYLRLLEPGSRLATLIKLFLLGVTTPTREAVAAFAPLPLDKLAQLGVLETAGETVRATVELVPTEQLLIASDTFRDEATRPDHVLGLGPPAKVLAALTVRQLVESALDVGTGNGVQALLATQHAERVTAVDINERALSYAAFNALLNGVPPFELRQGDLFEPVVGSSFDLIVCNPPYVISPRSDFVYRDSGFRGDAFCEKVVRTMPAYLRDGGFGHALISWLHPRDADWSEPPRRWLEGSGCDAIVLRYATHEPLEYAASWNRPLRSDADAYAAALDTWQRYFDELGVEAISWGAIVLRRRAETSNWTWTYSPTSDQIGPSTEHLLRLFAGHDFLAGVHNDDELLDEALALVPDHRLEEIGRVEEGKRAVERTVLRLEGGLRFEVGIDAATAAVIARTDGERRLRDVLTAAAAVASAPVEQFTRSALPIVRRLVELGFLVHVAR